MKDLLPGQPKDPGVTVSEEDNRFFVNVILFVAKTGLSWRDLPESIGPLEQRLPTLQPMGSQESLATYFRTVARSRHRMVVPRLLDHPCSPALL
ncbi:MAG: transposase [Gemmataceae bacterium]